MTLVVQGEGGQLLSNFVCLVCLHQDEIIRSNRNPSLKTNSSIQTDCFFGGCGGDGVSEHQKSIS